MSNVLTSGVGRGVHPPRYESYFDHRYNPCILGVIALASEGITYTKTEKVLDIGPVQATQKHKKTIPISPIAGGAAVAAGIVLVIVGAKRP